MVAAAGIAALFIISGVLAIRVMTVPSHLRAEASAPSGGHPTLRIAKSTAATTKGAARNDHRASRSDARTPSPAAKATTGAVKPVRRDQLSSTSKSPSPTSSPRPQPKPSPSPSSSGPVPLPTLSP